MDFKALMRAQTDSKAIPAHPALLDQSTPLIYRGDGQRRKAFGQRTAAQHLAAYGGHESIDWVMDCVKLIVETAAEAEWFFSAPGGQKLLNEHNPLLPREPVADPLLVKLFQEPNPFMDWPEFMELTLIDYLLVGNAYWLKYRPYGDENRPLAHYRLAPPHVRVVPGPFGVEGYEYDVPGVGKPLELPVEAVLHFRQSNPHDPYLGLGTISGGARMLDMDIALTDTMATYFEKRATPSLVVQSDRRVPTDVSNKLKASIRSFYGGSRNAGEIMVLEAGLKASAISPSAHEAAFESLTKLSRDRVLALFRVPGPLLGISDQNVEKINEAQRVFDTKTMRPLLDKFQRAVTRGITRPGWDVDFNIDYTYVMPPEERLKLVTTFASIPGVRVREIREYAGLDPLGDERDDYVLNMPGEDGTEEDHDGGLPDRNLGSEPGRPPNPENTAKFPKPGGVIHKDAEVSRKAVTFLAPKHPPAPKLSVQEMLDRMIEIEGKAPSSGTPVLTDEARTDTDSRIERPKDTLEARREAEVDALVAEAQRDLADAAHYLERALLDHIDGKAPSVYQRIKNSPAWRDFTARVTEIYERLSARAIQRAVLHQGAQGRRADDEIDYEAIAKTVVHSGHTPKDVADTLRKQISEKVLEAQRQGLPHTDLQAAVRETIDGWSTTKAEGVALDAGTEAYNEGTITVAELLGYENVHVFDGTDHDDACKAANGQTWTIEEARANRLEHHRCRRAFTPA